MVGPGWFMSELLAFVWKNLWWPTTDQILCFCKHTKKISKTHQECRSSKHIETEPVSPWIFHCYVNVYPLVIHWLFISCIFINHPIISQYCWFQPHLTVMWIILLSTEIRKKNNQCPLNHMFFIVLLLLGYAFRSRKIWEKSKISAGEGEVFLMLRDSRRSYLQRRLVYRKGVFFTIQNGW